jgi:L-arabinose isomerase
MSEVAKAPMLKPPITKTNVLKMDNNFKGAMALYDFVISYDKPGYTVEHRESVISPFGDDLADEMAEAASLVSFLAYEYGLGMKKELKEDYLAQEERLKAEKVKAVVTDEEIDAEVAADKEIFDFPIDIEDEVYRMNTRACLSIRKWIEKEKLDAFSVNFLKACPAYGIDSMPFIEACKAMTRGIGYAGEGDALDAVFCGALIRAFGDASFVEIFCPDWKNDILFLSHMGEMNYRVAAYRPEVRLRGSNYVDSVLPMAGYSRYKAGNATYLNIFRDAEGFCLVASEVEMLDVDDYDQYKRTVRGWMKPSIPVKDFLRKLSEYGATHHSMLVYDVTAEQMMHFGKLLNMKVYKI